MIDLHSHLVPAVDDGVKTHNEAFSILRRMEKAYPSESTVVFTPHFAAFMPANVASGRKQAVSRFIEGVSGKYNLEFLSAGELLIKGFALDNLETVRYPGTGYVLVEFDFSITWMETLLQIERVKRRGYRPLVAHPERYKWCIRNPFKTVKLSKMGCGIVVSARSLLYPGYAETARLLLARGLSHALASDAHSSSDYILDGELRMKLEDTSRISWDALTGEIPWMILQDRTLPVLPLGTEDQR
ncbi:MAG: CpsB/CapC family capsule biosynthesis tyrosine phosphatase [Candidatus Neomarinimicrobiota bacterium]